MQRFCTKWSMATGWPALKIVLLLCTISCSNVGIRFELTSAVETHLFGISCAITIWYSFHQDAMKRPTFETLQWKLEDFFTMSDSEYKDASAYWSRIPDLRSRMSDSEYKDASAYWPSFLHKPSLYIISSLFCKAVSTLYFNINHTYILWHPSVNKLQCWTTLSYHFLGESKDWHPLISNPAQRRGDSFLVYKIWFQFQANWT